MKRGGFVSLLKSLLHNIGVAIVGFALAFLGTSLDSLLDIADLSPVGSKIE
jgi:hypothetical protein